MAKRYNVSVKVIRAQKTCDQHYQEGEKWVIGARVPEGICSSALQTLLPNIRVLMFGGSLPWEDDPDVSIVACPDSKNPVLYELRRIRK